MATIKKDSVMEVGKYIDGKIMIYDEFYGINDGNTYVLLENDLPDLFNE